MYLGTGSHLVNSPFAEKVLPSRSLVVTTGFNSHVVENTAVERHIQGSARRTMLA